MGIKDIELLIIKSLTEKNKSTLSIIYDLTNNKHKHSRTISLQDFKLTLGILYGDKIEYSSFSGQWSIKNNE